MPNESNLIYEGICKGIIVSFFRNNYTKEFDKNANSNGVVVINILTFDLFGDNWSLRFLCVGFGWRIF